MQASWYVRTLRLGNVAVVSVHSLLCNDCDVAHVQTDAAYLNHLSSVQNKYVLRMVGEKLSYYLCLQLVIGCLNYTNEEDSFILFQ